MGILETSARAFWNDHLVVIFSLFQQLLANAGMA